MCDHEFKVEPTKFSFTFENGNLDDYIDEAKKENVSIELWESSFPKEGNVLIFHLVPSGVDSIYFRTEELPKENLTAFIASTKEKNATIKLVPKTDDNKWLTFEVAFSKD